MRVSPTPRLAAPPLAAALAVLGAFAFLEAVGHGGTPHAPPAGLWEWGYRAAFSVYLLPFALAAASGAGFALRVLAGLALQAAAVVPFFAGLAGLSHDPCLLSAAGALSALSLARRGSSRAGAAAFFLLVLGAAATLATSRHEWAELATGLALGWGSYRLAFSPALDWLEQGRIWPRAMHELRDLGNLLLGTRRWEESYAEGHWDFLDSLDQRPRHFAIAGLVADAFPAGASVLDIGCGLGTTYRCLARPGLVYRGVDCSEEAIARCRKSFGEGPHLRFEAMTLEQLDTRARYDVVILNEVLYYLPLAEAERVFRRARAMLASDQSLLVVSMNRNWKAALLWRRLARAAAPALGMQVTNLRTGSYWTVKTYQGASLEEDLAAGPSPVLLDLMTALAGDRLYHAALELDCGDGSLTLALSDRSLSVTALGSEQSCEEAAEFLGDRPWVAFEAARPSAWEPPAGRRFDLIAAGTALDDCARSLVARLAGWLTPGGRIILASRLGVRRRELFEEEGLTLVAEQDVEPAGGGRCVVSLLERRR